MQRRNQVGEANAWLTHYRGTDRQGDSSWHWWGRFPEVISQETQILDIYPVNLLRRKHLVGKTKLSSVGFSWRAKPGAIWPLLVAKGHFLRQLDQILLHLALNPARILLAQHKKVWSMPGRDIARIVLAAILQFDLACGLTVQFQNVGIVVDQVGKGEFISMALKLDRKPHFEGGICPADIPSRTAHPAGWRGCANVGNDCFRLVDQAKPPTPLVKCLLAQHPGTLLSSLLDDKDMGKSICSKNALLPVSPSCSKYIIQNGFPATLCPFFALAARNCRYGRGFILTD